MLKKILIIEDDEAILDVMTMILSDEGYEVIAATDSSPLKNIIEIQPAIILMDNRLTDGFGEDICRGLKSDPAKCHIPIVLVSANTDLEQMAASSRADAYLQKPFNIVDLVNVVNRLAC